MASFKEKSLTIQVKRASSSLLFPLGAKGVAVKSKQERMFLAWWMRSRP